MRLRRGLNKWRQGRPPARPGWLAALVALLVAGLAVAAAGCGSQARPEPPLRLGFLPSERAPEFESAARAFADALAERLGRPVEIVVPSAYEPLIESLRFGSVDAAFMDAGPASLAWERAGTEVVLAEVRADGRTFYFAEAFVRADSEFQSLADLAGRRLAFTSWTGSSGFLLPAASFRSAGLIDPKGDDITDLDAALARAFASHSFAGGYAAALALLVRGSVDACFGADDAPLRFLTPADQARVRTLTRLGKVPSHPVVVRSGLPLDVRERFVTAMLALSAERPDLFRRLYGVEGVVAADNAGHLGEFRQVLSQLPALHGRLLRKSAS